VLDGVAADIKRCPISHESNRTSLTLRPAWGNCLKATALMAPTDLVETEAKR